MKTEYKANPVEYFHAAILDNYHVWRKRKGEGLSLSFKDGSEFSNFIAEAKTELYKQFPELYKKP
jgi:hypothetical protein